LLPVTFDSEAKRYRRSRDLSCAHARLTVGANRFAVQRISQFRSTTSNIRFSDIRSDAKKVRNW